MAEWLVHTEYTGDAWDDGTWEYQIALEKKLGRKSNHASMDDGKYHLWWRLGRKDAAERCLNKLKKLRKRGITSEMYKGFLSVFHRK